MSRIIDYMRELDLVSSEKIKRYFMKNNLDTIMSFDKYMRDLAYKDWCIADYSPYSFAPSMDLSGFGGCSGLNCKIERADRFNKFISLYGDTVYFIVNSIANPRPISIIEKDEVFYRRDLISDYTLIYLYSGLIEKNIAKIIPPHFSFCPDCFSKHIVNNNELLTLEPIIEQYCNKAIIELYSYNKTRRVGIIEIKNIPELFSNHNGYRALTHGPCMELFEKALNFPEKIENYGLIYDIIKGCVHNQYISSKYEAYVSSVYQSKFVTSKPFDKTMIDLSSKQTTGRTPYPVFDMPFFANVDTETILKLRECEYHAFNDYRVALDKATKSYIEEPSQFNTIYDDIIYPSFIKLDKMFERTKRNHIVKNISEVVVIASTVTFGLMNSIIPADPLGIATALGGTGALVKYVGDVVERKLATDDELEKQDFYFLWELNRRK